MVEWIRFGLTTSLSERRVFLEPLEGNPVEILIPPHQLSLTPTTKTPIIADGKLYISASLLPWEQSNTEEVGCYANTEQVTRRVRQEAVTEPLDSTQSGSDEQRQQRGKTANPQRKKSLNKEVRVYAIQ